MNRDLDDKMLKPGEYREALNINVSKSESSDIGAVENILGNELIVDTAISNAKKIGEYRDNGNDRIYYFITNNNSYNETEFSNNLNKLKLEEKKYNLKKGETFKEFQNKIDDIKDKTNLFVDNILKSQKKVFALGASTKGNILLQHFGLDKSKIPYISERNPEKVGLKCLGSDIELISEEVARSKKPEAFIVLPWNFKDEIVRREKNYLDSGGTLMFPMPYPHTVDKNGEKKL